MTRKERHRAYAKAYAYMSSSRRNMGICEALLENGLTAKIEE